MSYMFIASLLPLIRRLVDVLDPISYGLKLLKSVLSFIALDKELKDYNFKACFGS